MRLHSVLRSARPQYTQLVARMCARATQDDFRRTKITRLPSFARHGGNRSRYDSRSAQARIRNGEVPGCRSCHFDLVSLYSCVDWKRSTIPNLFMLTLGLEISFFSGQVTHKFCFWMGCITRSPQAPSMLASSWASQWQWRRCDVITSLPWLSIYSQPSVLSFRDGMHSLAHCLVYFIRGFKLPWREASSWGSLARLKAATTTDELCKYLPFPVPRRRYYRRPLH